MAHPCIPVRSLVLALGLATPAVAAAHDAKTWAVLPVQATEPPPQDPTLLRLTKDLGAAVHDAIGADVRVLSREEREERCPDRAGVCEKDLADTLGVEHAVSIVLADGYNSIHVRVYGAKEGLVHEGDVPCRWDQGNVACEAEIFARLVTSEEKTSALEPARVEAAFRALVPKLSRCKTAKREEGDDALAEPVPDEDVHVSFRVRPDGHVIDVRVDPREHAGSAPFRCMARLVESLELAPFAGTKPAAFRFALADKAPEKVDPKKAPPAKKKAKG